MQQQSSMENHAPPQITPPPKLAAAAPRKALFFVGLIVVVLLVAGAVSLLTRMHSSRVLAETTVQNAVPSVAVVHPTAEKPDEELVLPALCRPMSSRRFMRVPTDICCAGTKTSVRT